MPALMDVGLNALSLFFFFLERLLSPSLSKMALDSSPTFLIATLRLWLDFFSFVGFFFGLYGLSVYIVVLRL